MQRLVDRDTAALKVLYQRHSGKVMAVATRILRQAAEAEEVVQETFLDVWKRSAEFAPTRGSVTTWVLTIARSRAIDRLRSRAVRARTSLAVANEEPEPRPSPVEDVEQKVSRERIAVALAELPREQREALEMAYFEGLSQREIAERTGEPLGTIKTRVRLGVGKLAGLLGGVR